MARKILTTAFGLTLALNLAAQTSGMCGDSLTWQLTGEDDSLILVISGMGAMTYTPWYSYRSNIRTVAIGSGVTSIGYAAFYGCSGLTTVTIPDGVTSVGNAAFYNCSGLTTVTIPNGVTSIGNAAFQNCSGLTAVAIPSSVTSIGIQAFYGCSNLIAVTIPNSVTSIGSYAFNSCSGLKTVELSWNTPLSVSSYIFGNLTLSNMVLRVPAGTKAIYAAAEVWKEFGSIIE